MSARPEVRIGLRPITRGDVPEIMRIERRTFTAPWSPTMFSSELARPGSICVGATADRDLVGYLICSPYGDAWHIMNVAVDPRWRGLGLGASMLESVLERTDRSPHRGQTLEVRVSNAAAIRLYERHGFTSAGVRRRYYSDDGEDALIMWRLRPARGAARPDIEGGRRR